MPALINHQAFQRPFVNLLCSAVTNQTVLIRLFTLVQCFILYFNYTSYFPTFYHYEHILHSGNHIQ